MQLNLPASVACMLSKWNQVSISNELCDTSCGWFCAPCSSVPAAAAAAAAAAVCTCRNLSGCLEAAAGALPTYTVSYSEEDMDLDGTGLINK
jgi:hypothetical protein